MGQPGRGERTKPDSRMSIDAMTAISMAKYNNFRWRYRIEKRIMGFQITVPEKDNVVVPFTACLLYIYTSALLLLLTTNIYP